MSSLKVHYNFFMVLCFIFTWYNIAYITFTFNFFAKNDTHIYMTQKLAQNPWFFLLVLILPILIEHFTNFTNYSKYSVTDFGKKNVLGNTGDKIKNSIKESFCENLTVFCFISSFLFHLVFNFIFSIWN